MRWLWIPGWRGAKANAACSSRFKTWYRCKVGYRESQLIGVVRGGPGGRGSPIFLAYSVMLCFEKRRHKQKYCCSPKGKHSPHKFWAGYATVTTATQVDANLQSRLYLLDWKLLCFHLKPFRLVGWLLPFAAGDAEDYHQATEQEGDADGRDEDRHEVRWFRWNKIWNAGSKLQESEERGVN